jgi:hypothetical protein
MSKAIEKGEDVAIVSGETVLKIVRHLIRAGAENQALEQFGRVTVIIRSSEAAAIKLFAANVVPAATTASSAGFDPPTCEHKPL